MSARRVPIWEYQYVPENKQDYCQFLERWASNLCLELDRNHPRVILVEELVVEAIHVAGMQNNTVTTPMLMVPSLCTQV